MKDRAVITLPFSPTRSNQFSRAIPLIVAETISNGIDASFHLCVNKLDSFNDRTDDLDKYQKIICKRKIEYDDLWIDSDHIDELYHSLDSLIKLGYIYELDTEIYKCDCGIISIEEKNLLTINPDNKLFKINNNGDLICNKCNTIAKKKKEKVLVFDAHTFKDYDLKFYPDYLNKDIKTFNNFFSDSYVIISRDRSTNLPFTYNGNKYYLDIDFLWELYLSTFSEKDKVIICGNKELYQMYLVGIFSKCLNIDTNELFIGVPIINGINDINFKTETDNDILTNKLAIIFNITWNAKNKNFDNSLYLKLKNIPYERKLKMYEIICNPDFNNNDFYDMIKKNLRFQFNYQEVTRVLKRR